MATEMIQNKTLSGEELLAESGPFLKWLANWWDRLPVIGLNDVVSHPDRVAAISVDLIDGFCYEGPLSGPRVAGIVEPTVRLFHALHNAGVTRFVLTQDTHEPDAPEFAEWGVHCVRGTSEANTVKELRELPFAHLLQMVEKNSTSSAHETEFDAWLDDPEQAAVDTYVVVGDCTDLCTYQLAMHLKLRANAAGRRVRVVVPENCVQTYDMPVATANELGLPAHDGNFLHLVFLYHMALNGCEVVRRIETAAVPA